MIFNKRAAPKERETQIILTNDNGVNTHAQNCSKIHVNHQASLSVTTSHGIVQYIAERDIGRQFLVMSCLLLFV
jgi:hypothetical protein